MNIGKKRERVARCGAVAVEFAFMAPVLLTIVMGLVEMTRIYDSQNLLENAAREGARFAAMGRTDILDAGESANAKIIQDTKNFMASAGLDPDDVDVSIVDFEDPTQIFDIDDPANDLKLFQVSVSVPFSSVSYTSVSESNDYSLVGTIVFRNGRAVLSQ